MKHPVILLVSLFVLNDALSQSIDVPEINTQYFRLHQLYAPSVGDSSKFDFGLGYQGFTGIRRNRYSILAYGQFSPGTNRKQRITFNATSDRIGAFIQKTRAHLGYINGVPLSNEYKLFVGGNIGLYNQDIRDNPSGVSGGLSVLNGNIGTHIQSNQLKAGLSFNQVFNNEFNPFETATVLRRHVYYFIEKSWEVSLKSKLISGGMYRQIDSLGDDYGIYLNYDYAESFGAGISYLNSEISLLGFYRYWSLNRKSKYDIGISYSLPTNALAGLRSNSVEITVVSQF